MTAKFSFTKEKLLALPPRTEGRYEVQDTKHQYLRVRVTEKGVKTFCLYRRTKGGQPIRVTLGRFPGLTVENARKASAQVNAEIETGADPAAARRCLRAEHTFQEALEEYLPNKRKRDGSFLAEKTRRDYRDLVAHHFGSLKTTKLSQVTKESVLSLRDALSKKSKAQADKAVRILSTVFNFMSDRQLWSGDNPAKRVQTNAPVQRARFLDELELPRFMRAVEQLGTSPFKDYFVLLLLTGVRKANLCAMRWSEVDLNQGTWRIPMTKNGSSQNVALCPDAVELLILRQSEARADAQFVFPGSGASGHLVSPKKAWGRVLEAADLVDVRIHDLRRTFGSWQLRTGASIEVIGKSLNHKSSASTRVYAQANLQVIRPAVHAATAAMMRFARPEVVPPIEVLDPATVTGVN